MTSISGDLADLGLPLVLESVAAQGRSGILTVQGADDIVAVSFLDGQVVSADALNQTVEEGLGAVLRDQGLINESDFAAISREHQGGSTGSLGDLLVQRSLISREELLQALRAQTSQLMLEIMVWSEGEFKFYAGDEISYEEGFQPLPVAEILLRDLDPSEIPDLGSAFRQGSTPQPFKIFEQDGDGTEGGLWLTQQETEFLRRLDGRTAAGSQLSALEMGDHEARFSLHKFLRHGLAELSGSAAAPRPAQPKPSSPAQAPSGPRPVPQAPPAPAPLTAPEPSAEIEAPIVGGLRPEIFTPPSPEDEDFLQGGVAAQSASEGPIDRIIGPALAAIILIGLLLTFQFRPGSFLLPFPWQGNQRDTVHQNLRQTLFGKIEQAANAYFLMQAHYPDTLLQLVELGLLDESDLNDPAGYRLDYSPNEVGYRIDLVDRGQIVEGLGTTEAIRGDFLLNHRFFRAVPGEGVPLVLLD